MDGFKEGLLDGFTDDKLTVNTNAILFPDVDTLDMLIPVCLTPSPYAYESLLGYGPDDDVDGPSVSPS